MVSINYATREVSCKIVYYGPGLSGKTTNLQYVHMKVPSDTKGKLISLATDSDRTLYFDFLPINIGAINGFAAKFQLYTVPGQVYYNATRKLVLRGVDGLVFVADSQHDKMDENIESFNNLKENLVEYGYKLDDIPIVIQYNKQDLPGVMTPEEMRPFLNTMNWPEFKASATEGFGVFDTLKNILKQVLDKAKSGGTTSSPDRVASADLEAGAPATPAPAIPVPVTAAPQSPAVASQPVPEPQVQTTVAAPPLAARHTEEADTDPMAATPVIGISTPPVQSVPVEEVKPIRNETLIRESAPVKVEPAAEVKYRPFPGNSAEDELRMRLQQQDNVSGGSDSTDAHQQPQQNSNPAGVPRMEPSMKRAEIPQKKKKRSFFKRLFGLK